MRDRVDRWKIGYHLGLHERHSLAFFAGNAACPSHGRLTPLSNLGVELEACILQYPDQPQTERPASLPQGASLVKIILDTGPFRRLVKESKVHQGVQGLLDVINAQRLAFAVTLFELWPEYIGLARPAMRNPSGLASFRNLASTEALVDLAGSTLEFLVESYETELAPDLLEKKVRAFMEHGVSKCNPRAHEIANDIVFFKGQDFGDEGFSWKAVSRQLAIAYAVDELFWQTKYLPGALVDAIVVLVRWIAEALGEYGPLPVFRLVDSIVEYLPATG